MLVWLDFHYHYGQEPKASAQLKRSRAQLELRTASQHCYQVWMLSSPSQKPRTVQKMFKKLCIISKDRLLLNSRIKWYTGSPLRAGNPSGSLGVTS